MKNDRYQFEKELNEDLKKQLKQLDIWKREQRDIDVKKH